MEVRSTDQLNKDLDTVEVEKAPLASPAFTGTPTISGDTIKTNGDPIFHGSLTTSIDTDAVTIPWTAIIDTHSGLSAGVYTMPSDGKYKISGAFYEQNNTAGTVAPYALFYNDASQVAVFSSETTVGGSDYIPFSFVLSALSGDEFYVLAKGNSATNILVGGAISNNKTTHITIERIGD